MRRASEIVSNVSFILKVVKLVVNCVALVLYRLGRGGEFLGAGGSWAPDHDQNLDVEILASGLIIGGLLYTGARLVAACYSEKPLKCDLTDFVMNVVNFILWNVAGMASLFRWAVAPGDLAERRAGLAIGSTCVVLGAGSLLDAVACMVLHETGRLYAVAVVTECSTSDTDAAAAEFRLRMVRRGYMD